MKRYVALLKPDGAPGDPEAWRLVREGFAPLALAFPVPWLLIKRLWLAALVAFIAPFAVGYLFGPTAGLVANIATGIAVAVEGRNWRIMKWERRGWCYVSGYFAHDRAEAEDRLAMLAAELANGATAPLPGPVAPTVPATDSVARMRFSDRRNRRLNEFYGPPAPDGARA